MIRLAFILWLTGLAMSADSPLVAATPRYAVAIHGGAGGTTSDPQIVEATLRSALTVAKEHLANGGDSLDAVEQVVAILEDADVFNAGKGSTFNAQGRHELDASIMDGQDRKSGAVAGLRVAKNPIRVARLVMAKTKHVLLSGDGADAFAETVGAELAPPDYFWTDRTRKKWQRLRDEAEDHYGTVGCVALDTHGNLAAATSTGGLTMKRFGRVGDSPLIGAGTWADNQTCAVSCTGIGELFIRDQIAYDISARIAYGKSDLAGAVHHHLHESLAKDTGGVIAIGVSGEIVLDYNTTAMPRAAADSSGRFEVFSR